MNNLDLTAKSRSTRARSTRADFLLRSTLLMGGAMGMGALAACSPGSRTALPAPGVGGRTPMKSFKYSSRYSNSVRGAAASGRTTSGGIQTVCSDPTSCDGGGGTIDVYSNVDVRATSADGSQYCEANELSTTSTAVTTSSSSPLLNNVTIQSADQVTANVPYTSTYSNNSSITRTVADDNATVTGTYLDPSGNTWQLTALFSDTSVTITYSGPQSGSITVSTGDVTYSAGGRAIQRRCSATTKEGMAKTGLAFDVASLWLIGLGIGAPVGVAVGVIGAGLGLYAAFIC